MTILIFDVRAGRRLLVRRPRDTIQCAGLYQPSIYHHHHQPPEGGGGGADQENCVEKELGGNTEIYLQVNTVAHPSYSYCTNTHCVLCTLHKRNKQNKPICVSSITK